MAIPFLSNEVVNGTTGNDSMIGIDPNGNNNDIVYGHQGDDTITTTNGLFNSTVYGGQGNDSIEAEDPGARNIIYGNFGDDSITSEVTEHDTIYGGQGNDTVRSVNSSSNVIYGNLGNDALIGFSDSSTNFYGGQNNDTISDSASTNEVIYGNFGDDLLIGNDGTRNTHEYGGQGNDTLVFTGTGGGSTTNDVETGNLGNDLFIATNDSGGASLNVDDIVTITDFLQGTDKLSETSVAGIPLVKIAGNGDNAAEALNDANHAFTMAPGHQSEYVFVYGGVGAGYLFYNGDSGGKLALSGMAIEGATGESSVNLTDITTIPEQYSCVSCSVSAKGPSARAAFFVLMSISPRMSACNPRQTKRREAAGARGDATSSDHLVGR